MMYKIVTSLFTDTWPYIIMNAENFTVLLNIASLYSGLALSFACKYVILQQQIINR